MQIDRRRLLVTDARDDGFTLIELLVTIVLVGMVTLAVGNALISFIDNTDATSRRLAESDDAQITAAYFAQDVASSGLRDASTGSLMQSVDTSANPPKTLACGSSKTPIVYLGWDDPTDPLSTNQTRVAYVVEDASGERQLHRLTCEGSSTVVTDKVLARHLAPTGPSVSCRAPTGHIRRARVNSSCGGSGGLAPQAVTMVLELKADPSEPGPAFSVTLTGERRQTP